LHGQTNIQTNIMIESVAVYVGGMGFFFTGTIGLPGKCPASFPPELGAPHPTRIRSDPA
jgi:hypothetical protein